MRSNALRRHCLLHSLTVTRISDRPQGLESLTHSLTHYWVFFSWSADGFAVLRPRNMTIIADGNAMVISVALMKWDTRWIDTKANSTRRTQQTYATAPITLVSSLQHTNTRLISYHCHLHTQPVHNTELRIHSATQYTAITSTDLCFYFSLTSRRRRSHWNVCLEYIIV